ncbi:hypothetical protein Sm713_67810 [Streptomyces sp. TS71-3]|nr:hypothetical protein Sm713_67810 [Streptomyces sp. TS71-3]
MANLGDNKMDVRLGGIYALQRIMQDSTRERPGLELVCYAAGITADQRLSSPSVARAAAPGRAERQ